MFLGEFTLPRSFQITGFVSSPIFWLVMIVASVIALNRRLFKTRRFVLMSLAGLVGMVSETLLLMNYQNKNGVLYQDIGILLMTFMIGLAFGAFITGKFLAGSESSANRQNRLGALMLLGFGSLNVIIYYAIKLDFLGSLVSTSLMLVLDGIFVSAIFAFISLNRIEKRQKAMTWLYSADLIGGSIGALIASLILLPVFGVLDTSLLASAVAVCALAFLR
jgi:hypothetical protein